MEGAAAGGYHPRQLRDGSTTVNTNYTDPFGLNPFGPTAGTNKSLSSKEHLLPSHRRTFPADRVWGASTETLDLHKTFKRIKSGFWKSNDR